MSPDGQLAVETGARRANEPEDNVPITRRTVQAPRGPEPGARPGTFLGGQQGTQAFFSRGPARVQPREPPQSADRAHSYPRLVQIQRPCANTRASGGMRAFAKWRR